MPATSENQTASPKTNTGHGTLYIVLAIIAAIGFAWVAPAQAMHFDLGGQVFLRLLQMVVVPLVMASVMSGILGLGDVRKLGRPGAYAVLYYFSTTVFAVITGLVVVNMINPGQGIDPDIVRDKQEEYREHVTQADGGT